MFGGEFFGRNNAHSPVSRDAEKLSINFRVIIFGHYIIFRTRIIIWTFWIQICSDYHLNSIYIYYCYIWLVGFCYLIMYTISVYCKCISTCALGILKMLHIIILFCVSLMPVTHVCYSCMPLMSDTHTCDSCLSLMSVTHVYHLCQSLMHVAHDSHL